MKNKNKTKTRVIVKIISEEVPQRERERQRLKKKRPVGCTPSSSVKKTPLDVCMCGDEGLVHASVCIYREEKKKKKKKKQHFLHAHLTL